jgi:hypothetical protein
MQEEYVPVRRFRSSIAQIIDNGAAEPFSQRQESAPLRLYVAHAQRSSSPINVIKSQLGDIACPQPQLE